MAANNTLGTILKWGIVGVGVWWIYEQFFVTPAAASGTTATGSAQQNLIGVVSQPVQTQSSPLPVIQSPPSPYSISALGSLLQAKVSNSGDPAIDTSSGTPMATPDVFNYYLAQILPSPPHTSPYGWPPNALQVFPGVDRSQPMPFTTYWNAVSAYLGAQVGMSGLGMIAHASRRWPAMPSGQWGGGNWWGASRAIQ